MDVFGVKYKVKGPQKDYTYVMQRDGECMSDNSDKPTAQIQRMSEPTRLTLPRDEPFTMDHHSMRLLNTPTMFPGRVTSMSCYAPQDYS
jgi:hypothetical protein